VQTSCDLFEASQSRWRGLRIDVLGGKAESCDLWGWREGTPQVPVALAWRFHFSVASPEMAGRSPRRRFGFS
jgi:hypothetical protein